MRVRTELYAATVCLAFAPAAQEHETSASIDALVEELVGGDPKGSFRAEQKLLALGERAVGPLVTQLEKIEVRSKDQIRVLRVLGHLGADATAALPALLRRSKSSLFTGAVLAAVDGIAPYAPEKKQAIIDSAARLLMRRGVAVAFGEKDGGKLGVILRTRTRLELHHKMTLAGLVDKLGTGNSPQRELAAQLIVNTEGDTRTKLEALRQCFADVTPRENVQARFDTATSSTAIVAPVKNLDRERTSVARAIVMLAPTRDVPAEAWIALLRTHEPELLRRAMQAVGAARAAAAVPGLVALTRHAEPTIQWEAITTLGMLGPAGEEAIPHLEKLSTSADKATAVRASAAIRAIRSSR